MFPQQILYYLNQLIYGGLLGFDKLERLKIIDKKLADKLKKSVGFRNIAVHNYDELDLDLTFDIASKHIDDFRNFIKRVVEHDGFSESWSG